MMWSKNKILVVVIFILIIIFGFFWIQDSGDKYDQPVGGFEKIQPIIESKFGQHEDLKKAALQLAQAIQKAIDYPQDAVLNDPDFGRALDCFSMIHERAGIDFEKGTAAKQEIRDLVVSNSEKQRRYIRYNSNLSGQVLDTNFDDPTTCNFQITLPEK